MRLRDCSIEDIPKELILLWEADVSVDSMGNEVGFKNRLTDIGLRYGFDSLPYRIVEEIINWLKEYNK